MAHDPRARDFIDRAARSEKGLRDVRMELAYHKHLPPSWTTAAYAGPSNNSSVLDIANWDVATRAGEPSVFTVDATSGRLIWTPPFKGVWAVGLTLGAIAPSTGTPYHVTTNIFAIFQSSFPDQLPLVNVPWDTDSQTFYFHHRSDYAVTPGILDTVEFEYHWSLGMPSGAVDLVDGTTLDIRLDCRCVDAEISVPPPSIPV